jgi:choline dehydrogenase-like flavoprotein
VLLDAQSLPEGQALAGDVVIIGGGPAGIAAGLALARAGRQVVLLEAGGLAVDAGAQELYAGETVGVPYFDLDVTRLRMLGGSTNHWGNQVSDFEPIDFARRDWIPHSGWPIGRAELQPWYERAFPFLDLGAWDLDRPALWQAPAGPFRLPDLAGRRISTKLFRRRPEALRVGEFHRDALIAERRLAVYLQANVTEIVLAADGRAVAGLRGVTAAGRRFTATGTHYLLACGGLENARLLLASDAVQAGGIGNDRGLVGRFFMDHLRIESGILLPSEPAALAAYADSFDRPVDRFANLYLTPAAQRENGTAVFRLKFFSRMEGETSLGYRGARGFLADLKNGRSLDDFGTQLARMIVDLDGMATGLYAGIADRRELLCVSVVEQVPNPDSRVTLSAERDRLGMRRLRLDWRLSELDRHSFERGRAVAAAELAAAGLGRARLDDSPEVASWSGIAAGASASPTGAFEAGHHHTGTTRMAADPSAGVVDPDGRVFGVGNLFVAGSSTFPTLGSANPTLTVVALALRLADHLARLSA